MDQPRTTEHQRLLHLMQQVANDQKIENIRGLADRWGISAEAIYKWCRNERVPVQWAKHIERETKGRVPRQDVSPWAYQ